MPTPDLSLAVRDLTARAGSFNVGPITLHVPAGRILVILGPSGSGKTTLLTVIAGLRPSLGGRVRLAGQDITAWPPESRRIGMVFQDGALFPHLTVRENIRFGPRALRLPDTGSTDELLGQLGITHLADRPPRTLSGGERQRVALARALAIQPQLLLLDEPLSALDQPTREDMRGQLLTRQSIPAIHVTHDRDEAFTLADDLAIIADGTIRQAGTASDVAAHPADPAAAKLLGRTELGTGLHNYNHSHVRIGGLTLPAPPDIAAGSGAVQIYYRPEDVLLHRAEDADGSADGIRTRIRQIELTAPLARIRLATTNAISALTLQREIRLHNLGAGSNVIATLPPDAVRMFPDDTPRT